MSADTPRLASDWRGHYFDGRTPVRQPAGIRMMATGLEIAIEGGPTLWWPYGEVRQSQGSYAGEHLRFERGGELSETLVVPDPEFVGALHRVAPDLTRRFQAPTRPALRWPLAIVAAIAVVVLGLGIYAWGLPAFAAGVAARVPPSWESSLGERTVAHLAPPERRCTEPRVTGAVQDIMRVLLATRQSPYTFRVFVVDDAAVNAFAAPGGFLVVNRGLLEQTRTPEELAGVLAHEVQHVLRRHATRSVVQHASAGLLIAAVIGEPTGAVAYGIEAARLLGALRYSRLHEEEADAEGMKMILDARIDPRGMIAFFEGLQAHGEMPRVLKYVSTHPATRERVDRLRALAGGAPPPAVTLLAGQDWDETKKRCASAAAPPARRRQR